MSQLDLVNAAVAVNSADSLDEALDALAETCRRIARAPNALVTVWEAGLSRGEVRAAAGDALVVVGETVASGDHVAWQAARSGEVALVRTGAETGIGERQRAMLDRYEFAIAVPLVVDGAPPITFQVAWPAEPTPHAVERTIGTVQKLASLTGVAFRAAEERARVEQSELLRRVIETVPDGIVIRRGDTELLNAAARRMLCPDGQEQWRERLGPRWPDGTPVAPSDYPSTVAMRSGAEAQGRVVCDIAGVERVFEIKAAPMADGYVGLVRDVTEEYSEHALTREFLTQLFETLPLAAVVLDAETFEVLEVNTSFESLVGYTSDELAGTREPHAWCDNFASVRHSAHRRVDAVYRRKDGRALPVELLRFAIAGSGSTPARVVLLAQDMTERREFDRRLIQSGKLAAIGELASGVAHEINNPLFAILGLVEFLLRDAEEGTKAHERLLLIQQTGLEIKEIVKALLDFARERVDDHRPIYLRDVVRETVELVRRTTAVKDVEIVEQYLGEPAETVGSPNQIKQVVLNLLTNAQQAMPDGGTVTVTVEVDDDWVTASVADDGPGIAPDVLQRIFEPFFTTKRDFGGTGLGLAVSHGIAEMHGGGLIAESPPGGGATFRLRLPRYEGEV
jgi:PAS domain S-box-containing protein